ncbi:uncharacterized protein F5147DRAFT_673586 [Suillus discolor]|uniref:Uncharacterized protein n=1 Tax=Suillus discolor TaxID=1912936 RepID=A0A9P7JYM5_9AGAM|nr:uncharacterized protein F5147DRAFT_673586 [Suillus discolor]KAG2116586.1 hypothetical protein F5147DRAFT_673586 [Suillus discolor]
MTVSYPLCVFLESRDRGKLPAGHPFCHLVRETVHSAILDLPILHHMARNTLENPDEVAVKQRAQEIIQHLQNTPPTFSGSDSPVMHSTFIDVRPKDTRKHIYVQKRLVDNWMKEFTKNTTSSYLLTIFMRLCLIRGLIAVIKLAFASEEIKVKPDARGSPCSLENFLSQWNGWLEFERGTLVRRKTLPYRKLCAIVFSDRATTFSYVRIGTSRYGHTEDLERLASGDWTVLNTNPCQIPYDVFLPHCLRMWDSAIDPKPRKMIESEVK